MSATISDCGTYRYWLERGEADAPYVAWVLANPSTADAELDDPTVRKARGFTERWGYKRFVFVNVFAYRSTSPCGLLGKSLPELSGDGNEDAVSRAVKYSEFTVVAWGNAIIPPLRHQASRVFLELVQPFVGKDHAKPIQCLGYTKDRQPRHPLMLAYTTPLEIYRP